MTALCTASLLLLLGVCHAEPLGIGEYQLMPGGAELLQLGPNQGLTLSTIEVRPQELPAAVLIGHGLLPNGDAVHVLGELNPTFDWRTGGDLRIPAVAEGLADGTPMTIVLAPASKEQFSQQADAMAALRDQLIERMASPLPDPDRERLGLLVSAVVDTADATCALDVVLKSAAEYVDADLLSDVMAQQAAISSLVESSTRSGKKLSDDELRRLTESSGAMRDLAAWLRSWGPKKPDRCTLTVSVTDARGARQAGYTVWRGPDWGSIGGIPNKHIYGCTGASEALSVSLPKGFRWLFWATKPGTENRRNPVTAVESRLVVADDTLSLMLKGD